MPPSEQASKTTALVNAGSLLEPDDVTFSVLVRGYGESEPPQWLAISGLLSQMSRKYDVKPSTGDLGCPHRRLDVPYIFCVLAWMLLAVNITDKCADECAATFNALLDICARTKDESRGYEVLLTCQFCLHADMDKPVQTC